MIQELWNVNEERFNEPFCYRSGTEVLIDFGTRGMSRMSKKKLSKIYDKVRMRPDVTFVAYTGMQLDDRPPSNMKIYLLKEVDFVKYRIQLC